MPQIRQYVSQEAARGRALNTSRAQFIGLDLSPVARGVNDMMETQAKLAEAQRRASDALAADEARVSVANTMSEAQTMWTERIVNAQQQAPRDAAGFTEKTLSEFDAWAEEKQSGDMHPVARRMLADNLRKMRLGLHADAFNFEVKQRNSALVQDFGDGLDADRLSVMVNPSLLADTLARRVATAQSMNLPAAVRDKMVAEARAGLAFDAGQGLVSTYDGAKSFLERTGQVSTKGARGAKGSQAPDAAERVKNDLLLSSLEPADMRKLIDRASMTVAQKDAADEAARLRRQHEAEMAAARRERAASRAFDILTKPLLAGYTLDQSTPGVQNALKALQGTPYAEAYKEMLAEAPKRQQASQLPIAQQQAELDALNARRNTKGWSPELEAEVKRREHVLAEARKDYGAEPLRAASERNVPGLQMLAPVDMSTVDGLVSSISGRVQQADTVTMQTGKPVSPLMGDEAGKFARQLATLPADQKAGHLVKLAEAVPQPQMLALAEQIAPKDEALSLAIRAGNSRTTAGRFTSELILRGAQKLADTKAGGGKGNAAQQQDRATMVEYLDGKTPGMGTINGEARDAILKSAELINAGFDGPDPKRAVRLALGGDMVEHNGRRIPVPAGIEYDQLRDKLRAYPAAQIEAQARQYTVQGGKSVPFVNIGGRQVTVPQFVADLPAASLVPAGMGRYYVSSGAGIATGIDGKPIVIDAR